MTYYPDMSSVCQFRLTGDPIRSIGWLSGEQPFSTGVLADCDLYMARFSDALQSDHAWGYHTCEFCSHDACPHQQGKGQICQVASGNGVALVPGSRYLFVTPVMLGHYITIHQYLPPAEFLDALCSCPSCKSFDAGSDEYLHALGRLLSFRKDGQAFIAELRADRTERRRRAMLSPAQRVIQDRTRDIGAIRQSSGSTDAPYYVERGLAYMQETQFEAAIEDLSQAISISPMVALYYLKRAECYMSSGSFSAAVADFSKVIELSPYSVSLKTRALPALTGRAMAYDALGEKGLAAQDRARAQEIAASE
jgi:hypothetical protein